MNSWIKLGCFLTGWNKNILSQCSEASHKALKKYASSMLILIILWGFTGFCFAERYVKVSLLGCVIAAIIAIIFVIQIERQIILTVGKNRGVAILRICLAVIMAILGSTIIDQIIFKDDVTGKMEEIRTEQVNKLSPVRQQDLQREINNLTNDINSLENENLKLNDEIALRPTITTSHVTTSEAALTQISGNIVKVPIRTVTKVPIENPRIKQVASNEKNLERMHKSLDSYNERKLGVSEEIRKKLESHTGFLDELYALYRIMGEKPLALVFYVTLFLFLIFIELLVVISKVGDNKSDYEMVVEHQLNVRKEALEDLVKKK